MNHEHACRCNETLRNPYLPMSMVIQRIVDESDDRTIKSFDLAFARQADQEAFQFTPGQFCELSLLDVGEAPFGIASSPTERAIVRFTIKQAGVVTSKLHTLKAGDVIGLRGPLGNHFPLERMAGKDLVIIGGGFAFTTLRALILYLLDGGQRERYGRITVVYGARTPGLLMYKEDLAAWEARDDITLWQTIDREAPGWTRKVGFVPAVVEEVAPSAEDALAIICGPPVMIRFTLPVLTRLGFDKGQVYTSLENRMQCGIGKCGRCNVGPKYVCIDGPVFSLAELDELPPEY
jgi:sulfhydrogenase subunit gamma (sulfur reductase)